MGKDPLEAVKRKVYLAAIVLGLPAVLLLWANSSPATPSFRPAFALFILFCLACAWAFWRQTIPIRLVERVTFAGGAGFALAQLAYALYASDDLAARTTITEVSYLTLAVLYVAAHLVFDSRNALRVSLALYAAGIAIVLVRIPSEIYGGLSFEEVSWLLRMHAFMGAVIAIAYAWSYINDQFSQQRAETKAMHRLAHTDQLTGIANRRQLYSEIHKETEEASRYERPLAMILFDLNHFKRVNDTYGHDRGDVVLREVVRVIEPLLRKTDRLGRWGGEEFMILAPESDITQAGWLAERIRASIAEHEYGFTPGVTVSLGLAQYKTGETPEALITRADEALYKAKTLGRNRTESIP